MPAIIKLNEEGTKCSQFKALIYGDSGEGKSTAGLSLLLKPNLKMVLFAPESTTIPALQNAMRIYGIEELEEGKLIVVIPPKGTYTTYEAMVKVSDTSSFNNLHKALFGGVGVDAATGKQAQLKKLCDYDENTILFYDGWTAVMEAIDFKTQAEWEAQAGNKDKRNMYQIGQVMVKKFFAILDTAKAHVIVTAHCTIADTEAQAKYKHLKDVIPNLYTKSLTVGICGKFSWVFLAKRNSMNNRYTLSVAESNAFVRDSFIQEEFNKKVAELNKGLKLHEKITLSELPTDLTHPIYDFLK